MKTAYGGTYFVRYQIVMRGDGSGAGGALYFDDLQLQAPGGTPYSGWMLAWSDEFNSSNVDSLHVLSELLKRVTPEGNIEQDLREEGQREAIHFFLQNIEGFQETLDEFRARVINVKEDSLGDKKEYERLVKEIKKAMVNELDAEGYSTGRAMDRELVRSPAAR